MELNINVIALAKIQQMQESGEIQKRIEEGVEKSVYDAIDSAVKGYKFKKTLEENVEKSLGDVASNVSFEAYKGFLIERMAEIVNANMKSDLASECNNLFQKLYLSIPSETTMTEIIRRYKEMLEIYLDGNDRKDCETFEIHIDKSEFGWYELRLCKPKTEKYGHTSWYENFEATIHVDYSDKTKGRLSNIRFGGVDFSKQINFAHLSEFETFIFNLYFTNTAITLDIADAEEFNNALYD